MAQLDEIVGRSNIQGILDADSAIIKLDQDYSNLLKKVQGGHVDFQKQADTWAKAAAAQSQLSEQTKKLNEIEKESAKIEKEQAAAIASLEKQRQAAYAQMAKQEQKERELSDAIRMEVKSIKDAETQNKALLEAKKKLNLTTEEGRKKNEEYNKTINKNTEFIRANSDAATKQRMNIGNYKSALEGLPGPIGKVTTAAGNFGKQLWALVANPIVATIAALVAGLKLLYDSFKSTDEGADLLDQTTSALSATWKVITDRIGGVITGNIKLKDAFTGVREEITMTAAAAANYAATMDTISERQSLFISEEAQLKKEQAELTRVWKDATKSNEERRAALERTIEIEEQLASFTKQNAAEVYRAELVRVAQSQTASNLTIEQIQAFIEMSTAAAEELKNSDPVYKAFWNTNVENVGALEQAYADLTNAESDYLEGTAKAFGRKTAFDKEIADNAAKAAVEANTKQAAIEAAAADRTLQVTEMTALTAQQIELDTHAKTLELREQMDNDFVEKELERIEEANAQKLAIGMESARALGEIGNLLFAEASARIQSEMDQNEKAKEYELQLAGDNAAAKTAIEEKYEKKARELKIKQARQNKAQALFQAVINTALATTNGFLTVPFFPLGLAMGILAGALGTIQIGLIAAQQIPQFYKGTKSAPDGVISVAERGEELIKTRSGKLLMARRPTLLSGMKGATIYSNKETRDILKFKNAGFDSDELKQTLNRNNEDLIRAIRNKRELYITPAKGTRITERQGDYYKTYFNRKLG